MNSTLKKIRAGESELTVFLDKDELNKYAEKAETELAKGLQIDGFRKGKVPKELARKQLGENRIRETALDIAVQDSLGKSLKEQELEIFSVTDLKVKENDKDRLVFSVVLRLFPDMTLPDISQIRVAREVVSVTDKEIDDAIELVRSSRAKMEDELEPAKIGDKLEVDFEVRIDGRIIEGGESKNHPVVLGNNNFIPGFEDNLIGVKKSEEKEFSIMAPGDYFNKDIAGKKLDFTVKVQDVKKVIKPELNDEFAKSLGSFSGLVDLRNSIRDGIQKEKEIKEQQKRRLDALYRIGEKVEVEIPEYMIDERLEDMLVAFDQELHQKGLELSLYLAHLQKTRDDLKKEWRSDAEKQVKNSLVIKKIAKEKNFDVTPEEAEDVLNRRLEALVLSGQITKDKIDLTKLRNLVTEEIVNERALQYIEKICTV